MPKSTFFRLPEEKQRRLLAAAKTEFSRASVKEASVANIVRLAEIPRGSFYQYFENKEDLYYYYFNVLRQASKKSLEKCISEAKGDLFKGMDVYFSRMIFDTLKGEHSSFYKHLFMNMDDRSTKLVSPHFTTNAKNGGEYHKQHPSHQFYQQIDFTKLKIKDTCEFKLLMQILMNIVFTSIVEGYGQLGKNPEDDGKQTIEHFKIKLNWLKNGAYN